MPSSASLQSGIWDTEGGGSVAYVDRGMGQGALLLPGLHWFTSGLAWPGSKHGVSVRWAHGELWGSESRRGLPFVWPGVAN